MAAGLLAFALERALAARWEGRRAFVAVGIAAGLLTGSRYLAIAVLPGSPRWRCYRRSADTKIGPRGCATSPRRDSVGGAHRRGPRRERASLGWAVRVGYRHSFRDDQVLRGNLLEAAARNLYLSFFAGSRGLVFFAFPIVVLGAVGLLRLWRSDRAVAASLLLGIASTAVPPAPLDPLERHLELGAAIPPIVPRVLRPAAAAAASMRRSRAAAPGARPGSARSPPARSPHFRRS